MENTVTPEIEQRIERMLGITNRMMQSAMLMINDGDPTGGAKKVFEAMNNTQLAESILARQVLPMHGVIFSRADVQGFAARHKTAHRTISDRIADAEFNEYDLNKEMATEIYNQASDVIEDRKKQILSGFSALMEMTPLDQRPDYDEYLRRVRQQQHEAEQKYRHDSRPR